ncbi:hypothetical protein E1293_00815 [Actinomadura darangshiensis]|uniref:Uncharacterized protein n=1 Tax=Actinomadura darangshiensis TaxID=705336 RepID=A0A4R5BZ82_9ACTN|nr:hypothetical protein [Actinomadura darangshiensis]TDD92551.1 hypothetical protein E1293_00815 [Actinomadura darangshiensis]
MLNEPSPGERLAAALRRSPLYVDSSLASALPAAERRRLLGKLKKAPAPVFIVLVPLVKGGTWTDAEQLATVVHDRLGRDGIFITFDDDTDGLSGREWGGDHHALDAAGAVNIDRTLREAPLAAKLSRVADLLISGTAEQEYDRLSDELSERVNARKTTSPDGTPKANGSEQDDGGLAWALGAGAAGVAVVGAAGFLLWRRRRMASVRREGHGLLMPRTVFATASRATEDQLREQASREVIAFGELLDETSVPTTGERTRTLMARALDAYQAAGKTLDAARGAPDLAGVLVVLDQGRDALASAQAVADGKPEIPPVPLCFFNPLHGDATNKLDWRPLGSRKRLRVQTCRPCARAARDKQTPDVLTDHRDGREVPYYEADPTQSVWAETGYGQLREDLIPRILRGD